MNYHEENDYELIYLIRQENEDAKNIFYKKYTPIVESKAKKYFPQIQNKGYEMNDLVQEGMIGLASAINDYAPEKDVKFVTFANICIDRQILSFIRNVSRNKHQVLNSSVSLDAENKVSGRTLLDILNDANSEVNPEKSFLLIEEQEELKDRVKEYLTERERQVFDLRFEGFTYQEISMLLNMSLKSVDRTISRIKQKIINAKKDID